MSYSEDFLKSLMRQKNRIIYARITSLDLEERPQEYIEGRVTAGSINLDGASAIRRTCSLTLVTQEVDISNYYWGLQTKFKLEVGIENKIDLTQPEIIWFNQGIFLITTFSQSYSASSFTINISGKDKMSKINGEFGGVFNSSVDFGKLEEIDKYGNIIITSIPIKKIIREMLHQYGNEPFHNIIINDLDEMGLQLKEYAYDAPLYLFREVGDESSVYANATLNGKMKCLVNNILTTIDDESKINYEILSDDLEILGYEPTAIILNNDTSKEYYITKVVYGQTAGYSETELTYPGDLIANFGENIVTILDKIKQFLGDFEYFYDTNGQFIFQRKKEWVSTTWSPIVSTQEEKYIEQLSIANPYTYVFNDSEFFTAFNNTPNIANLKNDFTVWGTNLNNLPIHMRYAIDKKPSKYTSIEVKDVELTNYNLQYGFTLLGQNSVTYIADTEYYKDSEGNVHCDWREIIYQMSQDYKKYNHLDDFELRIMQANDDLYPFGRTGYEQYYIDLDGFWRQIYNPDPGYERVYIENFDSNVQYYIQNPELYSKAKEFPSINDHVKYYILTENNVYERAVYPYDTKYTYYIKNEEYIIAPYYFDKNIAYYVKDTNYYYPNIGDIRKPQHYWSKNVLETPENLLFWFDFLDLEGELEKFSVKAVGSRQKVQNDNNVKAIQYRDTPQIIFRNFDKEYLGFEGRQTGYKYFNISKGFDKMFYTSSQGKSAKEIIDNLLYNHAYIIESVSITSVPIYYLQPNTRIYISDVAAGIEGEYIASKLTIPLTYNGTMNIYSYQGRHTTIIIKEENLMKKIGQLVYTNANVNELKGTNIFANKKVYKLGIQGPAGTKFIINGYADATYQEGTAWDHAIEINQYGIYELDLKEGLGVIISLEFIPNENGEFLPKNIENTFYDRIIVDFIEEVEG